MTNEKNGLIWKTKGVCLPINVAHCIEEYTGASPKVDNNTIHSNMPTLIIGVVVVDVPLPCCKSMIAFPNKGHIPNEMCKIWSSLSLTLNFALASCQRRLYAAIIAGQTGRSTGTSLKVDTYITQSPSRYPITNSRSKRCTLTSLIGQTRGRPLKRHKGMEKRDLLVGLIRRRWITPLESSFCDLRSSSSHGIGSVLEMAKMISWPIVIVQPQRILNPKNMKAYYNFSKNTQIRNY